MKAGTLDLLTGLTSIYRAPVLGVRNLVASNHRHLGADAEDFELGRALSSRALVAMVHGTPARVK